MFQIDEDMTIYVTRGDMAIFSVSASTDGTPYIFRTGDVLRMKVMQKKKCENVAFQKDFPVLKDTEKVDILLTEEETKIGDVISKPVDYWYEVELNPYTNPQTIIGYDDDGAKIFKLFPEGRDLGTDIAEVDIPLIDSELSISSDRPVQNQAIASAVLRLDSHMEDIDRIMANIDVRMITINESMDNIDEHILNIASDVLATKPITIKVEYDASNEALRIATD